MKGKTILKTYRNASKVKKKKKKKKKKRHLKIEDQAIGLLQAHRTIAAGAHIPKFTNITVVSLLRHLQIHLVHANQWHALITADGGHIGY